MGLCGSIDLDYWQKNGCLGLVCDGHLKKWGINQVPTEKKRKALDHGVIR
jgi:hypothetical protein